MGFLVHRCGVFCIDIFSVTVDDTTDAEIRRRRIFRNICRNAGGTELVVKVSGRIVIFGIQMSESPLPGARASCPRWEFARPWRCHSRCRFGWNGSNWPLMRKLVGCSKFEGRMPSNRIMVDHVVIARRLPPVVGRSCEATRPTPPDGPGRCG